MSMEYTIQPAGSDEVISITPEELAESFKSQGFTSSIAPDRTGIHLVDNNGESAQIDINKYLEGRGDRLVGLKPSEGSANYDQVNPSWRAAIEKLGDPRLQKAYLTSALEKEGIKDAQIIGQGSDYYVYNPKTGQYNALTNKPGFDFSDVTGFVPQAAEFAGGLAGSVGGGLLGAGAGSAAGPLGTIAGGAFGAGIGGMSGRAVTDQLQALIQPDISDLLKSEEFQSNRNKDVALDAIGGGIGGALPGLLARKGIASTVGKGVGGVTESAGKSVGDVGAYLSSDAGPAKILRGLAENAVPGTGQLQLPAWLAQSGELIPKGVKALGDRALKKQIALPIDEAIASNAKGGLSSLSKLRSSVLARESEESGAQKIANALSGTPDKIAAVRPATGGETLTNLTKGTSYENLGKSTGNLLDTSAKLGRGVEKFNEKAVLAGTKGIQGLGRGTQYAGKGLKDVSTVLQPVENRMLLQGGLQSDEFKDFLRAKKKKNLAEELGYN